MISVLSEIQNDPNRTTFVSPAQYYSEVKEEYNDSLITSVKLSQILFRVACIGKGLHLINYTQTEFCDVCNRIITRYMIDGNVNHMRAFHGDRLGYVIFSTPDFRFYEFSEHKAKWVVGEGDEYNGSMASDIFNEYNNLVESFFPVSEKMLKPLSYQKTIQPDYIGYENQNINYYALSYTDIKETIFVLNRLYKEVLNVDCDYYDLSFSSRERLYTVFASVDETSIKDIEVNKPVAIKKDEPQDKIPDCLRKDDDVINGKIRVQIIKILQAVVECEIQGRLVILDFESSARSVQAVMLVSMIAIDYYAYRLNRKKKIIIKEVISDFFYRKVDISETCRSKFRDPDLKRTLRKISPEIFNRLLEVCRNTFPGFEELKNYPPRITMDYAFLKEKSPKYRNKL